MPFEAWPGYIGPDVSRTVERYELLDELGHGGMATVYRARDTHLDRLVALKVMHPHLRSSAEARVRFTREAKSVARLRHPHVLEVYDYSGESSEESYIAAELLTGPTLRGLVEAGPPVPAEVVAAMGVQLARALAAAHDKGVIHRDVKPDNVLLHEGALKLTDFGIAHMLDIEGFTATGQILGSPGHMAPEQVEAGDCDERTDVFALGTVLFYVATGRLPFSGRNPSQVLRKVIEGDFPDPLRLRPSIGGTLAAIISRAMARDPSARYPAARPLEEALVAMLADSGIDDPDECLRAYLADPEAQAAAIREGAIPRLIALGAEAAQRRDVATALAHWNRVLALDEGNEDVLRRLRALGRTQSLRRVMVLCGAALGATGLFTLGWIAMSDAGRAEPRPVASSPTVPDAVSASVPSAHAASVDAPGADAGLGSETAALAPAGETPPRVRRLPPPAGPRTVVFQPEPQNVLIGVDGAPPRPFGPSFRSVELAPGPHTFRFVAGIPCCEEATFRVNVEADDAPLVLRRTLAFRDARLYVVANVPATVIITSPAGQPINGRTRDLLAVPLDRLAQTVSFVVTAPGHRDYTGQARLRAGQVAREQVTLQAAASPP